VYVIQNDIAIGVMLLCMLFKMTLLYTYIMLNFPIFLVIKINYIMAGFTTYNFDTVGGLSIVQWNCNCLILHRSELICHCYEECA